MLLCQSYHMGHAPRGPRKIIFLTQQYRLFSNYSASLQMDICYSDYTLIKNMFEIKQLCLLGFGMLWTPPNPSQIGVCL